MPGVAMGSAVQGALAAAGVSVTGIRWVWGPGWKLGGTFEPHLARDGVAVFNPDGFVGELEYGAMPGMGPNGDWCGCSFRWLLRGAGGQFLPEQEGS